MTTKINGCEVTERRWRLLRFGSELTRRGMPYRIFRSPSGRWRLRLTGRSTDRSTSGVTVFCAGTEGVYVLVTGEGRILSSADRSGTRRAADLLTTFPVLRAHPAQESCAS